MRRAAVLAALLVAGSLPAQRQPRLEFTLPVAEVKGLPLGISFFGRAWSESKLLSLAADFEARTRARREPKRLRTIAVE